MKRHHGLLYIIEFLIIGSGFAFLLTIPFPFYTQLSILLLILIIYVVTGLLHHRTHHDISIKVVLEYLLIGALVFALFIFLNIARL